MYFILLFLCNFFIFIYLVIPFLFNCSIFFIFFFSNIMISSVYFAFLLHYLALIIFSLSTSFNSILSLCIIIIRWTFWPIKLHWKWIFSSHSNKNFHQILLLFIYFYFLLFFKNFFMNRIIPFNQYDTKMSPNICYWKKSFHIILFIVLWKHSLKFKIILILWNSFCSFFNIINCLFKIYSFCFL